ncbi:MAG: CRISPR-associated endonuclease Cas3'' [Gemmatimonadetes bacterium]|nr:CRISPR-associated endonuclease Cas3'' [Gemmatimonadota bacterium]
MTMSFDHAYAHTLPDQPEERWEPLAEHLENVAERAASFAAPFGAPEWGELAGLWHDLGKYKPEFQARLRGTREQVEHAGVGAAVARCVAPLETFFGDDRLLRPLDEVLGDLPQFLEREEAVISIAELDAEHLLAADGRELVHVPRFPDADAQPSPAEAGVDVASVIRHARPLGGTREAGLLDFGDSDHAAVHPRMYW